MTYRMNPFRLLTQVKENMLVLREAERLIGVWRWSIILVFAACIVYGLLSGFGLGTDAISLLANDYQSPSYEAAKFWFLAGRIGYAVLFACVMLFVPALIFYLFYEIPYQKLLVLQIGVLLILLVERLSWLVLMLTGGLDWYASPFSLGVIAGFFTSQNWLIHLTGAITVFDVLAIALQVSGLLYLYAIKKWHAYTVVILTHACGWGLASLFGTIGDSIVAFIYA